MFAGSPHSFLNNNIPVAIQSQVGTYLHVYGGNAQNDARVSTWSWVNQNNLKWFIESVPGRNDVFFIASACNRNFVVHQRGSTANNGDAITLWDKTTHGHQGNLHVRFEHAGDGFWFIRFEHSGKCVHVQGASTANDAAVTQWDSVNQNNLKWRFMPAGADPFHPSSFTGHGSHVRLAIQSGVGTFLHVYGGNPHDGCRLSTWQWVDQPNLKWHIEPAPNGQFFLVSAANHNFVVHQQGATHNNGDPCTTWNKTTHGHQPNLHVSFEPAGADYWYIRFAHSGKYLHVHGASTANDTTVSQWDKVDQPNLKWKFIPVN